MSALWPHARAMRVLGEEWIRRGHETGNQLAILTGNVHLAAADRLDAEILAGTAQGISLFTITPAEPQAPAPKRKPRY